MDANANLDADGPTRAAEIAALVARARAAAGTERPGEGRRIRVEIAPAARACPECGPYETVMCAVLEGGPTLADAFRDGHLGGGDPTLRESGTRLVFALRAPGVAVPDADWEAGDEPVGAAAEAAEMGGVPRALGFDAEVSVAARR